MTHWKVPLADIQVGVEEITAVKAVLESGWLSMGPQTQKFEALFAQYLGVKHALAVANGTAALHLACLALGLTAGDEVLCPALTFVASANAISYTGARPVFVDIEGPDELNLSVEDAARKITGQTRAIMVVHYGGYACRMGDLAALARLHSLAIIEDCAHAPGAKYLSPDGPRSLGTLGDAGCFSFFANKNLTTGEGGMVVTNDDGVAERIRRGRSHGMTTLTWDRHRGHSFSYDVVAPGYNYRLDEMRAALGSVQLAHLEAANKRRRDLTHLYREKLRELPLVHLPFLSELDHSSCHLFPVLLPNREMRAQFMEFLAARGIQTSIHYPPIHQFSYYQHLWPPGYDHRLPHTEEVTSRIVTLPLFPHMRMEQFTEVIGAIRDFFGQGPKFP